MNISSGGILSNVGSLTKDGSGTLTLSAPDYYTGSTTVISGVLLATASSSIPYGTSLWVGGGSFIFDPSSGGGSLTLSSINVSYGATLNLGNNTVTVNGAVTLVDGAITNGTILDDDSYTVINGTISASLDGSAGLTATGGIVVLTGTNNYLGGTTVTHTGTLEAASTTALPPGYLTGNVSVAGGGTLAVGVSGFSTQSAASAEIAALLNSGDSAPYSNLGIDVGTGNFSCDTGISDTASGPLGLVVLGSGTLDLTGSDNSYSGGTTIMSATLQLGDGSSLGTGPLTMGGGALDLAGNFVQVASLAGADVTIIDSSSGNDGMLQLELGSDSTVGDFAVNGGTLNLNGNSITVGLLGSNTDAGLITNNSTTPCTLTVDQDSAAGYFGDIQGTVSLDMTGSGVLVVEGDNNTYAGCTTALAGQFVVTNSGTMPDGTSLIVGEGGIFIFDPSMAVSPPDEGETPSPHDPGQILNSNGGSGPGGNAPTEPVPPIDTAPVVTSIQCIGQPLVDANSVSFAVTFSQPVTGVLPSDFSVNGDGTRGTVTSVSSSIGCWIVTVSGITGSGTLGLNVVNGGTILDWFGTPLATTSTIPVDQQYTIDRQLYWDASNGNGPAGGTGDWNGCNWHVGSPTGPLQNWCDGSDVVLAGTPGTISITSPVVVSSISVLSDGYVIDGKAISLGCPQTTIDVAVGSITIDCDLIGSGLVKSGAGTLVLGGTDSYSGSTTVDARHVVAAKRRGAAARTALTVDGGVVDLGGATTAALTTVTLAGGSIVDGTLQAEKALDLV